MTDTPTPERMRSVLLELARRFAALGDPVRLRLLSLLATSADGALCACDLVEPVGKSQPTVSHHLKVLREAGLVTSEKRGVNIWYAAVPAALELLPEELYFLRCIDGSRTTDELLARRPDLEVPQLPSLLLGLISAGVLEALAGKVTFRGTRAGSR